MMLARILVLAMCMHGRAPIEPGSAYDEAVAAWERQDWPAAADAFGRAFADDPKPELLWAQAQALRFAQDWQAAIDAYERFIALGPPELDVANARTNIERCRAKLAAQAPVVEPSPPPPRVEPDTVPPRPVAPTPRRRIDAASIGLLVGGLAGVAVGTGLVASGQVLGARAGGSGTEKGYREAIGDARLRNGIGFAFLSVGGALLVGSAIRFAILRQKRARERGVTVARGIR